MKAPEKIYIHADNDVMGEVLSQKAEGDVEYTRTDFFIEKARKWFEMQNEGVDYDGNYKCDMTDFEDFKNYMKEE